MVSKLTKRQPSQGALNIPEVLSQPIFTMSYLVRIKRGGDERFSSEHGGDVSYNGLQTVRDLLAGILSDSRVGAMNVHHLTDITVTVWKRRLGPVTPATE